MDHEPAVARRTAASVSSSTTSYEDVDSFEDMGLSDNLLVSVGRDFCSTSRHAEWSQRGVFAYGFEKPSSIQRKAIVPIIDGRDTIAQAQVGTGKTGAFAIGILQRIDTSIRGGGPQALVLSPGRELAKQSFDTFAALGVYMGLKTHLCRGGQPVREDGRALRAGVHVLVATPGRVLDLLEKEMLDLSQLRVVCLDEADRMLDRGFKEQVHGILSSGIPSEAQMLLFSATMPHSVVSLADTFMTSPHHILIPREEVIATSTAQYYVYLDRVSDKLEVLCDLYESLSVTQSIVFCNSRRAVDMLTEELTSRHFTVSATHGEMEQGERDAILEEFRSGTSRVLVTTDLLARGIDIPHVSLVLNFEFPLSSRTYVHRIGRAGRFGREGNAISLVTRDDEAMMHEIQSHHEVHIRELPAAFFDRMT